MIDLAAYALALALSQEPDTAATPLEKELAAESAQQSDTPTTAPSPSGSVGAPKPKGADEVTNTVKKLSSMKPEERQATLIQLQKQFGGVDSNPVLPTLDIDLGEYLQLPVQDQALVVARSYFNDIVAGDAARMLARSGFPFFMESRRVDRPEELLSQWSKSLRSRRTDLLKLYSVEVMTPAEMEKKFGKAPARLSAWNLKAPNTYVAVGNLSGHATILLLRQAGVAWQVVGFHD
ncbi:MAG: hypothetical protein DI536_18980 [Archangium gephyra]|uniref:Uncharacterized protein n=1 Tax=Archangium gephyra TaxID=48 RepID=A0A2W5T6W1_9BACT|nr:MAG: hypothetical protein DI536_18980 [Archangium gephyra]